MAIRMEQLYSEALGLLAQLIETPSFSREEATTAHLLARWLGTKGIGTDRIHNNVLARNLYHDVSKPTLLLNSHHDTVRPAEGYTLSPFRATVTDGKLYGLGSNDAGGALVSLMAAFRYFYARPDLPFNLMLAATAEEEISGARGITSILDQLAGVRCALVGEPTSLQMAVAERGLMVCDAVAMGVSGHAARNEGRNAIYEAMADIEWIRSFEFERCSAFLGPVSMNVTHIETENKAHNMVPDRCSYTIDVRTNELYDHEEVLRIFKKHLRAKVTARSMRLRSTAVPAGHPLVVAGERMGLVSYGSPTLSDKALMPFPALKIGPGHSSRSHTADEYIYLDEIRNGIRTYIELIEGFFKQSEGDASLQK